MVGILVRRDAPAADDVDLALLTEAERREAQLHDEPREDIAEERCAERHRREKPMNRDGFALLAFLVDDVGHARVQDSAPIKALRYSKPIGVGWQ